MRSLQAQPSAAPARRWLLRNNRCHRCTSSALRPTPAHRDCLGLVVDGPAAAQGCSRLPLGRSRATRRGRQGRLAGGFAPDAALDVGSRRVLLAEHRTERRQRAGRRRPVECEHCGRRRRPTHVACALVRAGRQQRRHRLGVPPRGGPVQRRHSRQVGGGGACPCPKEKVYCCNGAAGRRPVQRGLAPRVRGLHTGARRQATAHLLRVGAACGVGKRFAGWRSVCRRVGRAPEVCHSVPAAHADDQHAERLGVAPQERELHLDRRPGRLEKRRQRQPPHSQSDLVCCAGKAGCRVAASRDGSDVGRHARTHQAEAKLGTLAACRHAPLHCRTERCSGRKRHALPKVEDELAWPWLGVRARGGRADRHASRPQRRRGMLSRAEGDFHPDCVDRPRRPAPHRLPRRGVQL
mmetsp:Transcript_28441/g.91817  ORF Transcript_28441/g.91817 Transcript_28441/m.91817 type:complete len:408 (+) Transcript_28441:70-1293(+)|eukprot:scaffold16853_cov104-Isochrysis_galbana.AAC.2